MSVLLLVLDHGHRPLRMRGPERQREGMSVLLRMFGAMAPALPGFACPGGRVLVE